MSDSAQSTITTVLVSLLGGGTLGVAAKAWLESRRARDDGERAIRAAEREDTADFARAERAERQARDARIEEMHEELRRVSVEVATCRAEHDESKRDRAQLREKMDFTMQLNGRLKARVDELTSERDDARNERDELLRHVRRLESQVAEQREQIETLTERVLALAEGRPSSSPPSPAPPAPRVVQTAQDVRRYAGGPGFRPPSKGK